ncbi:MAG: response regulator [Oligoflexales bacterium]|nr:response regulator [Oligoflexales bacterium]
MKTVLIVDDDPLFRVFLKSMLGDCKVIDAENGKIALEKFKSIDLVITDICMPIMDGIKLIHKIRKLQQKEIPIIAVTGFINNVDPAKKAGADECLTKPFGQQEIDIVMERFLPESTSPVS